MCINTENVRKHEEGGGIYERKSDTDRKEFNELESSREGGAHNG